MELKWNFLLFMGAILSLCGCLDWMAGGTFTQANFATLRAKVDGFYLGSIPSTFADAAAGMSN